MMMRRFILLLVLFALTMLAPGCALFQPPKPEPPRTVEEWMGQKRINP
jgi:hypothetical protein